MDTADELLDKILLWLNENDLCAKELRKLANELDSLREKCNASECVGSTVSVVGAACLIGAGAATLFTGGAAAPFLGVLGAVYGGAGIAVSLTTKVIEHVISSGTMKDAEKHAKKSNDIVAEIMELIQKLMKEGRVNHDAEEDHYIVEQILGAMARRSRVRWPIHKRREKHSTQLLDIGGGLAHMNPMGPFRPAVLIGVIGTFTILTLESERKLSRSLISKGAQQALKNIGKTGFKTAVKGGALVVGGTVGMIFALSESIDNWKEMVKKQHVTEASRSLRERASEVEKSSTGLREDLDKTQKMFEEMAEVASEVYSEDENEEDGDADKDMESDQGEETNSNEERESDQEEETNSDEERESDQEEQTNSDEERESDQEEETNSDEERESDQEEQTNSDEEKASDQVLLISEVNNIEDTYSGSRMALFNVRSLNNKPSKILDIITENNLDVLFTTETWLSNDSGDRVLREASPSNFNFEHQPRGSRGGGVAIQYTNAYYCQQISFDFITTFEYIAVALESPEWDVPLLLVNIYFPPGYTRGEFHDFLDEFNMLLDDISGTYDHVIFAGDFNIHVDDGMQSSAIEFYILLIQRGLVLRVDEPTHRSGHTLDLVITWDVHIFDLYVENNGISDHYIVFFNAAPVSQDGERVKKRKN